MESAREQLDALCADLRLLRTEAGGPSLRALEGRLRLSKSQVGAILAGRVRRPPRWRVVAGLVDSVRGYATEHGRVDRLSLRTGVEEYWRPRYQDIERAFAGTRMPEREPPGPPVPASAPARMPDPVAGFTGRRAELAALDAQLAAGVPVATVVGTAGMGRTCLAVRWARRVGDRFPDGQLYADLRGYDPDHACGPAGVLHELLTALGVPAERIPPGQTARTRLYRAALTGRRVLVVLDDARDADQVRPLLPASPGCLALVTMRDRWAAPPVPGAATPLALGPLSAAHARALLATRLGTDRLAAEPAAVETIVVGCAGLPLTLAIVASLAASRPDRPLADLASDLAAGLPSGPGTEPAAGPSAGLRAALDLAYRALNPSTARLFRLLGAYPGPDLSAPAIAGLAGEALPAVRRRLSELTRAHLVIEVRPGRYGPHDLVRGYAARRAEVEDGQARQRAALRRLLEHYAHAAETADDDAWFAAEREALPAAVGLAHSLGLDRLACRLAQGIVEALDGQGRWRDIVDTQRTALAAATRAGYPAGRAEAHRRLSGAYLRLGLFGHAHDHLRQALELYATLRDSAGQAHCHYQLATVRAGQGRHREALRHARDAHALYQAAGHRTGQSLALAAAGWNRGRLGDHEGAVDDCVRALDLQRDGGDRSRRAETHDDLGYALHHLGRYDEAVDHYAHALALYQGLALGYPEARTLCHLGEALLASGDRPAARAAWREAVDLLDGLGHPDAERVRSRLAGDPAPARPG